MLREARVAGRLTGKVIIVAGAGGIGDAADVFEGGAEMRLPEPVPS